MRQYIHESWDLHAAAAFVLLCMSLLLYWCGAITLLMVPVLVTTGTIILVLVGLWLLAMAGGRIPW